MTLYAACPHCSQRNPGERVVCAYCGLDRYQKYGPPGWDGPTKRRIESHARTTDPSTSKAAARNAERFARSHAGRILRDIKSDAV